MEESEKKGRPGNNGNYPPVEHQIKKGEVRNPKGYKKGQLNLKTLIRKVWEEEIVDADGNPQIRAILSVKALADKAEKGDVHAFKALSERVEGMPKQEVHQFMEDKRDLTHLTNEQIQEIIAKHDKDKK